MRDRTLTLTTDEADRFDQLLGDGKSAWSFWADMARVYGLNLTVAQITRVGHAVFTVRDVPNRKCSTRPEMV